MIVLQEDFIMERLSLFLLLSVRLSALFLVAPIFSGSAVTVPTRTALMLGVISVMFGTISVPTINLLTPEGAAVIMREAVVGFGIGLMFQLAFAGVAMAGEQIAFSMGLGFASMVDPQTGVQSPVVTQFLSILFILIFLVLGGHHIMLREFAASYAILPIGADLDSKIFIAVVQSAGMVFSSALLISFPVIVLLFLINMLIGLMTRIAPQMNIFSVGFPVTILIGFVAVLLTLPEMTASMSGLIEVVSGLVREQILGLGTRA